MKCFCLLSLVGLLCLNGGTVHADRIAEPRAPQETTLTGTLSWEQVKRPDGSTVKGRLILRSGNRQVALPVTSDGKIRATKAGATIDVSGLVGKRVKLTAKVITSRSSTRILSVTRIQEDASAANNPIAEKQRELAGAEAR